MLFEIILREIHSNILSLKLHISLILTLVIFGLGTVAFVKSYAKDQEEYSRYQAAHIEQLRTMAGENLSRFAVSKRNIILQPRNDSFITDAREKYYPTRFEFSGYNVFGFSLQSGSANPYLSTFLELNWVFIVSIIVSFTVFLFAFDTISAEKEAKTR